MIKSKTTDEINSPWPSPYRAWYVTGVLNIAFVIAFIDRQIVGLLIGPIQNDLHITDTQVSLLGGFAFAFLYTFLGIPIGRLIDKGNRRGIIAVGVFVWSCMTVACGFAKSFIQLFFARVGVGVGEATLSPAALSILSDYFPRERLGLAVSVYLSGASIGTGLAFLLGGAAIAFFDQAGQVILPVIGEVKSWQFAFIVVGAPGILFSCLVLTFREPVRRNKVLQDASKIDSAAPTLSEVIKFLLLNKKFYLAHFAGFGLYLAFTYGFSFWAVEYFVRTFAVERSQIAYIYGAQVIVFGGAGTLLAGFLSDHFERKGQKDAKLRVAFWPAIPLFLLAISIPFISQYQIAVGVVMVMTFCWKFPLAPAAASLQIATPNQMRGIVTGLYLFVGNTLGLAVGPAVIGVFSDYVVGNPDEIKWSIGLAALIMLPASIAALLICRRGYNALSYTLVRS
tara:strand:+ start:136 stop:1491 length:1356 start_codon:yes stop_codon:yes gene_type:complete